MSDNNQRDVQAAFMDAINGLKEYARVNGGIVTKEDIYSYFKDLDMNESKMQMVYGYLMANNIKIKGEEQENNEFLAMLEKAAANKQNNQENEEAKSGSEDGEALQESDNVNKVADDITEYAILDESDYEEDEKYIKLYMQDLEKVEALSDTTRAFLLMNIVEDNDKDSLKLLSESFLEKIVEWIEPFRRKGVLSGDLIQEGNLAMMAYISEKRFLNNYEWKDKIKEGGTEDLLLVLKGIEDEVRSEVEGSIRMLIDEQAEAYKTSDKVLNKVNLVNDWAVRLKSELERKPTLKELAERMGVSEAVIMDAVQLSAEKIEDIDWGNGQ